MIQASMFPQPAPFKFEPTQAPARSKARSYNSRAEYYESEAWATKRTFALHRASYRCQWCKTTKRPLQVHHLSYANLYHEKPEDLMVLCPRCHQQADLEREEENAYAAYMMKKYGEDYEDTAESRDEFQSWREKKQSDWR